MLEQRPEARCGECEPREAVCRAGDDRPGAIALERHLRQSKCAIDEEVRGCDTGFRRRGKTDAVPRPRIGGSRRPHGRRMHPPCEIVGVRRGAGGELVAVGVVRVRHRRTAGRRHRGEPVSRVVGRRRRALVVDAREPVADRIVGVRRVQIRGVRGHARRGPADRAGHAGEAREWRGAAWDARSTGAGAGESIERVVPVVGRADVRCLLKPVTHSVEPIREARERATGLRVGDLEEPACPVIGRPFGDAIGRDDCGDVAGRVIRVRRLGRRTDRGRGRDARRARGRAHVAGRVGGGDGIAVRGRSACAPVGEGRDRGGHDREERSVAEDRVAGDADGVGRGRPRDVYEVCGARGRPDAGRNRWWRRVGPEGRPRCGARLGRRIAGAVDGRERVAVRGRGRESGVGEGRPADGHGADLRPIAVDAVALDADDVARGGPGKVDLGR